MNTWMIGIAVYGTLALGTAQPVLSAILGRVKLHPGGPSFDESPVFTDSARNRLAQHFGRMQGTLSFWKKQAELYKRMHYYGLGWTIPSAVIIPFLAQAATSDPYSKWLITVVSAHTAILMAFHKALKVDANYKAFRQGESEFYDLYRRLMDRPSSSGATEEEQISNYFEAVESVRRLIRNAEVDNFPTLEQVRDLTHDQSSGNTSLPSNRGERSLSGQ